MVKERYAFVAYYTAGLVVLDLSDPSHLRLAAICDTHPEREDASFLGAWGVHTDDGRTIYVGDTDRGLLIFRFDPP
jgi:hypothetical protein